MLNNDKKKELNLWWEDTEECCYWLFSLKEKTVVLIESLKFESFKVIFQTVLHLCVIITDDYRCWVSLPAGVSLMTDVGKTQRHLWKHYYTGDTSGCPGQNIHSSRPF